MWNEADLKKQIKKDLTKDTWHYAPVQTGYGQSGIPDIICCVPMTIQKEDVGKKFGLFVGIEAKTYRNKPTPLQQFQLEGIADAAGVALVVTGEKGKQYKVRKVGDDT